MMLRLGKNVHKLQFAYDIWARSGCHDGASMQSSFDAMGKIKQIKNRAIDTEN